MRMRSLLPPGIDAGTVMLHKAGLFLQSSIRCNRNHRGATAAVVCDHEVFARMIDSEVAWSGTTRWLFIEQSEVSCIVLDFISTDFTGFACLAYGIEELAVGMDV